MTSPDLLFKALADPARIRIIRFLARPEADCCSPDDEVCACDFETLLGLSQPTVSHHLKLLVQAGLVRARKDGRWVHYRLDRARFQELADWLRTTAGPLGETSVDRDSGDDLAAA